MTLKTNPNLSTATELLLGPMTPAERAKGRYMRAPDGHDAGEGDAGAGDAGDADAGATDAGDGGGDGKASGEEGTVLGGAADEGAKGEADKGEAGEGGDEGADANAAEGAPEAYDLKAPEGMEFDKEAFAAAEPVLRELNLNNEAAQKLVDAYAKDIVPKIFERANQNLNQIAADKRKEWNEAFEGDAEIGGANKDRTIKDAARAFDHYGIKAGEGIRQILDESGLGNHPEMIRFVARVGRDLDEGSFERGGAANQPKAPEQKLYGPEFQPQ